MKLLKYTLFFLTITIVSCQTQVEKQHKDYVLKAEDDGIVVEQFDSTIVDENKYNRNNVVFQPGTVFTYDFKHIKSSKELKIFKLDSGKGGWSFVDASEADSITIKSVEIEVANGNPLAEYVPDYNQTCLIYKISEGFGHSMSGAIENEANVWMHPPRDKYFQILELNPFPYIKSPYEIGSKWTWNLKIGNAWGDERWKVWDGQIENRYEYEITDHKKIDTRLGEIECFVVNSQAESRIGKTALEAFFNEKYGFVKLNYTNIDGSKTILELTEHKLNTTQFTKVR